MKIHIVKKGDSLNELAKKYHVELDQIIALNPQISDPNVLNIGEKVKLPSRPKPVEPPASDYVYKHIVQQGDSLWKLGKAWDVPLQAMIQANPQLKNPNVLMTGEVVYVPKAQDGPHQPKPLPGHQQKPSTAPFVQLPVAQTPAPEETIQPQISPLAEAAPVPIESTAPAAEMPGWAMPPAAPLPMEPAPAKELPSWAMPPITVPAAHAPETEQIELHEPYPQAVHPFKQFHIKATEVFAYPVEEQSDTPHFPAFTPYTQTPWEHGHHPVESGHYPVSDGGCGCGDTSVEPPWQTFPAGVPSFAAEEPWQGFPQGMPHMTGFYPQVPVQMASPYDMQQVPVQMASPYDMQQVPVQMASPYDMQQVPVQMASPYDMPQVPCYPMGPDLYTPHPVMHHGMMPHFGMPYPTPYESPILPQVQTHELKEVTDKEVTVDVDIRSGKKSGKAVKTNSGGTRKAKSSNAESINAFLRKQQNGQEKPEPKPNLPWINV
ncbi:LysM peptidoglycan-binding domain-containing protein [Paenibacillus sedimenti]|uniref:LysM peptidoglycan-binding domain-containing protein n=1 Tax=Paenibacillus sedimenti TaxID=2770274 RepID=A0A926KQP0_9BACL|nr:LysM peptidoglycan-binding domain-containing protein [Paenibacillus sedimenti]MBD0381712.1 LysM peptidoglycan-binding domain-containing protein [Paenibacillus sedimenti]